MNELNGLEESFIGDFDPDYFYYQQQTIFGTKLLFLQLIDVTRNSDLEPNQDDRLLRITFTLDAIGWLFKPFITVNPDGSITRDPSTTVPLINTVDVDYYDLATMEQLM
jgi:hypothetical protein